MTTVAQQERDEAREQLRKLFHGRIPVGARSGSIQQAREFKAWYGRAKAALLNSSAQTMSLRSLINEWRAFGGVEETKQEAAA